MPDPKLLQRTAKIVGAYVGAHSIAADELPTIIRAVHDALDQIGKPAPTAQPQGRPSPNRVRKSITEDHLISFEDGKPYKTLKRHLTTHGLTPEAYREKWGLPTDYPMTAPGYARRRSEVAMQIGLGQGHAPRGAKQRSKFDR